MERVSQMMLMTAAAASLIVGSLTAQGVVTSDPYGAGEGNWPRILVPQPAPEQPVVVATSEVVTPTASHALAQLGR